MEGLPALPLSGEPGRERLAATGTNPLDGTPSKRRSSLAPLLAPTSDKTSHAEFHSCQNGMLRRCRQETRKPSISQGKTRVFGRFYKSGWRDSNSRPLAPQASALIQAALHPECHLPKELPVGVDLSGSRRKKSIADFRFGFNGPCAKVEICSFTAAGQAGNPISTEKTGLCSPKLTLGVQFWGQSRQTSMAARRSVATVQVLASGVGAELSGQATKNVNS